MRHISLLFVLFLFFSFSFAQQDDELVRNFMNDISVDGAHEGIPYYAVNKTRGINVQGTAFLQKDWQKGYVMTKDDEVFQIIGRYNLLTDEIQIRTETGEIRALFPNKMKGLSLGDRIFIPHLYYEKGKKPRVSYFELLVDGEIPLYRHYSARVKNTDIHPVLGQSESDKELTTSETLYYKKEDSDSMVELDKKKKDILKVLSYRRNSLISFIRENRLSFRKTDDIAKMFEHHNELRQETEN